jgi:hypothetical protein
MNKIVDRVERLWSRFQEYHPTDVNLALEHIRDNVDSRVFKGYSLFITGQQPLSLDERHFKDVSKTSLYRLLKIKPKK